MSMSWPRCLLVLGLAIATDAVALKHEVVPQLTEVQTSEGLTRGLEMFSATPHELLETLGSNAATLHEKLIETSERDTGNVQSKKAEYEAKLAAQRAEIHSAESTNAEIALKIEDVRRSNNASEALARQLQQNCSLIVNDIAALKENISYASEFVDNALDYTEEAISKSHKLDVLKDFALEEQHVEAKAEHKRRLQEFSTSKRLSLMQTSVKTDVNPLTVEAIQGLMKSMGELRQLQKKALFELNTSFDADFQVGAKRYDELLSAQGKLNKTLAAEKLLHSRLDEAVKHLQKTQELLSQQRSDVMLFSLRFSAHMLPKSAEQPGTLTPRESNWLTTLRLPFGHSGKSDMRNATTSEVESTKVQFKNQSSSIGMQNQTTSEVTHEEVDSKVAESHKKSHARKKHSGKVASKKHSKKFLQ